MEGGNNDCGPSFLKRTKGVHRNISSGGPNMREAKFFCPPQGTPRGGANMNCKFKTFGFLDTVKVRIIQSNYLTNNTLSLLQTKLAEKNSELILLQSSVSDLKGQIEGGTAPCPPPCTPLKLHSLILKFRNKNIFLPRKLQIT